MILTSEAQESPDSMIAPALGWPAGLAWALSCYTVRVLWGANRLAFHGQLLLGPCSFRRMLPVQDASQVKSINEFTDSLAKALAEGDGIPSKELTRELLADGLRRALEIGGDVCKKRFLETLAANIHKFALQEQYSLSRVYPVEISSEYRNLQSFFIESATEGDPEVFNGTSGTSDPPALSELRRRLGALPQKPGPTSEELVHKFKEEQTTSALKAIDVRARAAFFAEVRLNLFRFSETAQKELVETFTDLKAEVVKLVDSTTQEVAAWLDEERVAVAWRDQAKQVSVLCALQHARPGTVVAWKTADYGFVKREGRHNDDIQLHVANAKGERFKNYIRRNGVAPGVRVKFDVDFEENRGRPYAANWELVDPPKFSESPSRSRGRRKSPSQRRKRSPSVRKRRSPSVKRRGSPSVKRPRSSPSRSRSRRKRSRSRSERKRRSRSRSDRKRPKRGGSGSERKKAKSRSRSRDRSEKKPRKSGSGSRGKEKKEKSDEEKGKASRSRDAEKAKAKKRSSS
eukprot:s4640_g4.t6